MHASALAFATAHANRTKPMKPKQLCLICKTPSYGSLYTVKIIISEPTGEYYFNGNASKFYLNVC